MELTVDIIDRTYDQIKEFCDFNNVSVEEYVVQCVEDDFFTRKYGDLNVKFKNKEETKEEEQPKIEEQPKVEKKKVGRPKKKVEEVKIEENNEDTIEKIVENNDNILIKKEEVIKPTGNKTRRIRRTLRTL